MGKQITARIPSIDKDYLRTIETMSVSDLTQALMILSRNVQNLGSQFRTVVLLIGATFVAAIVGAAVSVGIAVAFK